MTYVKICGITNGEDARAAVEAGADALGFVFAPSPRRIAPAAAYEIVGAVRARTLTVGVFRDAPLDDVRRTAGALGLDCVQLHGDEPPDYCASLGRPVLKRIAVGEDDSPARIRERMSHYRVFACLLDPGAGDGQAFRWELAAGLDGRIVLAGGLTPQNVSAAVRQLRPIGVDVSSGVERAPGRKDPDLMRAFVVAVRDAHVR